MMVSAVYLGTAVAARDAVIGYALERVPTALGKPIATLPKVQRQLGDIEVALAAARTLLLSAAADWPDDRSEREAYYPRVVAAKHIATETAIDVTEKALRIAGGASVSKSLPLERHFRDVRAGLMHPPAGDTALEFVGRHAVETFPKGGSF
jgi:alkylation response protein AidB-like acyl-CoA dehydrogenase